MPPMKVGGVQLLFFAAVSYTERKHGKGKGGSVIKFIKREFFPFWKLFLLLFAAGFVLGTVFANLAYQNRGQDVTELQMFSLEAVGSAVPDSKDYFFYLLPRRLAGMAVLQVIGATVLGVPLVIAELLGYGFFFGTFLGIALLQNGIRGMLLFAAALLPQYLLYVPAAFGMFTVICYMSGQVIQRNRFFGKKAVQYSLWCLLFLTVVLWGILLECYVNPLILQWLIES